MKSRASASNSAVHEARSLLALQAGIGIIATCLLVWEGGWRLTPLQASISEWMTWGLIFLALISEGGLALQAQDRSQLKRLFILAALAALALGRFALEQPLQDWLGTHFSTRSAVLLTLMVVQVSLVLPFALRMLRLTRTRFLQSAQPGTLFVGSFVGAILLGALLLKTPKATVEGISWLDALFTSASAICVTGLIVVDTELAFTPQGQVIILLLIQAGGLGIMTLTYFMSLLLGQGITLREKARLQELFSEDNLGNMGSFVARLVTLTLLIELIGAFLIHAAWSADPARPGRLVWDSLFHSVSAFCNAGFSTFSAGLADPAVAENRPSQVVVMCLIIAGGLGFAVLLDLPKVLWRGVIRLLKIPFPTTHWLDRLNPISANRLHTRLTIQMTTILLVSGAIIFYLAEPWGMSGDRLWEATFNSVTARTAGFNISNFADYGFPTIVLLCFLMFIGGSPGGTAGGVKTTTFAVALGELGRLIRGHRSLHIMHRRIPRTIVERCTATIVLSLIWVAVSIFLISLTNPTLDPVDIVFECFSAFGTVGLSRGITAQLDSFAKCVIIFSMLAGRVGILTLVLTFAGNRVPRHYELPDAKLPLN